MKYIQKSKDQLFVYWMPVNTPEYWSILIQLRIDNG